MSQAVTAAMTPLDQQTGQRSHEGQWTDHTGRAAAPHPAWLCALSESRVTAESRYRQHVGICCAPSESRVTAESRYRQHAGICYMHLLKAE